MEPMESLGDCPVIVVGAGPAGLTAAYELVKKGVYPLVLEKRDRVGGLARTEVHRGFRFDIGGHRFFTYLREVQKLWEEMLQEDLLWVKRRSQIFHGGRFFNYPLELINTLKNLGAIESLKILSSYFKAQWFPPSEEKTFEQWMIHRFGRRLFDQFFKPYTEKLWGLSCDQIQADWATQRIRGLSLFSAVKNIFLKTNQPKTLVSEFQFPVLGCGMMWESFKSGIEKSGGRVQVDSEVLRLRREGSLIRSIIFRQDGKEVKVSGEHVISTMPLSELLLRLDPLPPEEVIESSHRLKYRALILVGLLINRPFVFDDQWIYIHDSEARVSRIQNYKNWSSAMVPDPSKTSLGMEFFCTEGDPFWKMSDEDLIRLSAQELSHLGLVDRKEVHEGIVFRQPGAYPVYDLDYSRHLEVIQRYLRTLINLQTIGRNGLHRYNNQDHSMLTAISAVKNILGEHHDLWKMNTEQTYHNAPAF